MTDDAPKLLSDKEALVLMRHVTPMMARWISSFAQTLNRTEASREAGYRGSDNVLRQRGHKNFHHPALQRLVADSLKRHAMPVEELVARISKQASSDMSNFVQVETDENGRHYLSDDVARGIRSGHGLQIKTLRLSRTERREITERGGVPVEIVTIETNTTLEVYDPLPAQKFLLKLAGVGDGDAELPSVQFNNFNITIQNNILGRPV